MNDQRKYFEQARQLIYSHKHSECIVFLDNYIESELDIKKETCFKSKMFYSIK